MSAPDDCMVTMWRIGLICLLVFSAGTALAQDCSEVTCTPTPTDTPTATETPTITPTPTNTPTPTPDTILYLTLAPPEATAEGTPGTPVPGQAVAFRYETDAGQVMTNMLLFGLLVTKWIEMLLKFFARREE